MSLIVAVISAVSFYFLPILLGNLVIKLPFFKRSSNIIRTYSVGALSFFIFTFLSYFLLSPWKLFTDVYPWLLRLLGIGLIVLNLPSVKSLFKRIKTHLLPLVFILLTGITIYTIWRSGTTYPLPLNWDFFHHQTLVNQILSGHLNLLNSRISDTFIFNGYTPLYHLLLAWPQWLFNPDILQFFWWLEFFHLLTVLLVTYFISLHFFHNRLTSLLAVIFSGFIFESFMAYTSLQLIPQTLTAVLFVAIISRFSIFGLLTLFLLHFIVGTLAIAALFAHQFLKSVKFFHSHLVLNTFSIIAATLLIFIPFFPLPHFLSFLNQGEAASFTLSLTQKLDYLKIFSGNFLFIFFIIGSLVTLFSPSNSLKILLLLTLFLLLPVFSPIPYAFKFYVLAHYFVSFIAAFGFVSIFSHIHSPSFRFVTIILLIFSLSLTLASSSRSIKNTLIQGKYDAQISPMEIEAARFLKNKYPDSTTLLISDPATQQILEPLSFINTQGGAYMNLKSRQVLISLNGSRDPGAIYTKLLQINDTILASPPKTILFAVSSRYFRWQQLDNSKKQNLSYNIWNPSPLTFTDLEYISWLQSNSYFKLVYQNSDLAIFELKR